MATEQPEITLKPVRTLKNHPKPDFRAVSPVLRHSYSPSRDGTDSNLLILFHGLGDTLAPFARLGQSFNLPQTAVLSLQAPERVPLLEEEAWQWWDSFDAMGEIIRNPNPSATLHLLTKVVEYLCAPLPSSSASSPASSSASTAPQTGCGWHPSQLHFFGYQQGASCAGELALAWARAHPTANLGSLVAVSAPLLQLPTVPSTGKAKTKVALVYRGNTAEERAVQIPAWKKGFETVKEVRLEGGRGREGMPRGVDEWREIMRFWSETLLRRSALETEGEVYEIDGGVEAAKKAGAKAKAPQ
ncbi:hypothetical protein JCM10213_002097 [Rhodosporidiobolus nylandii]